MLSKLLPEHFLRFLFRFNVEGIFIDFDNKLGHHLIDNGKNQLCLARCNIVARTENIRDLAELFFLKLADVDVKEALNDFELEIVIWNRETFEKSIIPCIIIEHIRNLLEELISGAL